MMKISIVIPVLNERELINELVVHLKIFSRNIILKL